MSKRLERLEKDEKKHNVVISGVNINEARPFKVIEIMKTFIREKL